MTALFLYLSEIVQYQLHLNYWQKQNGKKKTMLTLFETKQGYQVECHISGGEMDLMSFKIYVPDIYQARMVKEKFHENPQRIYSILLASVTDDKELLSELFQ